MDILSIPFKGQLGFEKVNSQVCEMSITNKLFIKKRHTILVISFHFNRLSSHRASVNILWNKMTNVEILFTGKRVKWALLCV